MQVPIHAHPDVRISRGSLRLEGGCCLWSATPMAWVDITALVPFLSVLVFHWPHISVSPSHTDFLQPRHSRSVQLFAGYQGVFSKRPSIRNTAVLRAASSFTHIPATPRLQHLYCRLDIYGLQSCPEAGAEIEKQSSREAPGNVNTSVHFPGMALTDLLYRGPQPHAAEWHFLDLSSEVSQSAGNFHCISTGFSVHFGTNCKYPAPRSRSPLESNTEHPQKPGHFAFCTKERGSASCFGEPLSLSAGSVVYEVPSRDLAVLVKLAGTCLM